MPKEYNTSYECVGKMSDRELCKKFKFDHTNKCYMHNIESVQENDKHILLWDFEQQTDPLISARQPDLAIVNKKEGTCWIVDFTGPADHAVKLNENEKRDKNLGLARELKGLRNMKVTMLPFVISALGTILKRLVKELDDLEVGGQEETFLTITFLRSAIILRRILESWGYLLSLKLQWETII